MITDFTLLLSFLLVATSSKMEGIISWGVGKQQSCFYQKTKNCIKQMCKANSFQPLRSSLCAPSLLCSLKCLAFKDGLVLPIQCLEINKYLCFDVILKICHICVSVSCFSQFYMLTLSENIETNKYPVPLPECILSLVALSLNRAQGQSAKAPSLALSLQYHVVI